MPDNATPIEAISLNFYSDDKQALQGIDSIVGKLTALQEAIDAMSTANVSKISKLATSLAKLSTVKVPNSVVNNVAALSKAVNGVGNISTEKVDRATEAVERLQTISATSVKDLGGSDVSLARRYEGLSMFVDMSANSFARFNDQLMQTSMYSAITARSLDMLYQSMGIGMGTQVMPMFPAPQTAGFLPDIAQSSTALAQVERDLANIASGSAQFIATPISSYFRETAAAATDFDNALKSLSQQESYVVRGALPAYSSAMAMKFKDATFNANELASAVERLAAQGKSVDLTSSMASIPKMATTSDIIPLAQTDNVAPIQAMSIFPQMAQQVDFTARQSADSVNKLGKEVNNVAKESNKLGSASANVKALGKSADQAHSRFSNLFRMIKRIATYRLIRSALRMITDGFKQGIKNLYEWSNAFDKTREFANSMDTLATSVNYLKNSMGALVAPLINALAPAIDWLVDKFIGLMNIINRLFALLTGASTYTVAKKIPMVFGDTANNANKAAKGIGKATKALKSFTIGIDELNIIEDTPTSGRSGGSGGGLGDAGSVVEDMFETKETGTFEDFWENIKTGIEKGYKKVFGDRGLGGIFEDVFKGDVDPDLTKYGWVGKLASYVVDFADSVERLSKGDLSVLDKFGLLGQWAKDIVGASDALADLWENIFGLELGIKINDAIDKFKVLKAVLEATVEAVGNIGADVIEGGMAIFGVLQTMVATAIGWLEGMVQKAQTIGAVVKATGEVIWNGLNPDDTEQLSNAANFGAFVPGAKYKDQDKAKRSAELLDGALLGLKGTYGKVAREADHFWGSVFGGENGQSPDKKVNSAIESIITSGIKPLEKAWDSTEFAAELGWAAVRGATEEELEAKRLKHAANQAKKYGKIVRDGLLAGKNLIDMTGNEIGADLMRHAEIGIAIQKGDFNRALLSSIKPDKKSVKEVGTNIADSIAAGVSSGKSSLSSKLKKLVIDSTSGGKSAAKSKDVKDIGKYIVEGIIAGASDKKKDLEKAMKNLAKLAEAGFAAGAMIKSPSRLMAKDGEYLVQGLNMGIENEAHTTADVMDNWLSSISDSVSIDVSNISMPNVADIVDEVQGYIATTGSMSIKGDTETMQRFYADNIIPILSGIAEDAKRQADKEEKTEVVLDNRKVTSAVNRQNRVNGYSFT